MRTALALRRGYWLRHLGAALLAAGLLGAAVRGENPKEKPVDPDHAAKMARGLDMYAAIHEEDYRNG